MEKKLHKWRSQLHNIKKEVIDTIISHLQENKQKLFSCQEYIDISRYMIIDDNKNQITDIRIIPQTNQVYYECEFAMYRNNIETLPLNILLDLVGILNEL